MAQRLIESLTVAFDPSKYQDTYRHNLRALIDSKIRGEESRPGVKTVVPSPVPDILAALKASLAGTNKPVVVAKPDGDGLPKRSRKAIAS